MAADNSEQFPEAYVTALAAKIEKMKRLPPKRYSNPLKIPQTPALYAVLWLFFRIIPFHFRYFLLGLPFCAPFPRADQILTFLR